MKKKVTPIKNKGSKRIEVEQMKSAMAKILEQWVKTGDMGNSKSDMKSGLKTPSNKNEMNSTKFNTSEKANSVKRAKKSKY